jgi:hypothetical protein
MGPGMRDGRRHDLVALVGAGCGTGGYGGKAGAAAGVSGDSYRAVDRQLGRARRKLRAARRAEAEVG